MGYDLGVDLGGTSVAAAMATGSRVEMVTLGDRTVVIPAVVYLGTDGALIVGDAAARRAVTGSDRIARELKRRLANPVPVRLGDGTYEVTALLGTILEDVVARAAESLGSKPERVVLTRPAHWGAARAELFHGVPRFAGLDDVQMITEPEAAAAHHAASGRFADGELIAVYDLGGGTFDATVLRNHAGRIEIVGRPEGIEQLGGGNFDEAILAHINTATDGALTALDMRDPQNLAAVARLRQECILAKETLSVETEATIPVFLPNRHQEVRLSRADFEAMIHTPIETTIMTLIRTIESAQVDPSELAAVLLTGGSARIPLVARMISDALARPTVLDAHPKYAVALGAAGLGSTHAGSHADADATTATDSAAPAATVEHPSRESSMPARDEVAGAAPLVEPAPDAVDEASAPDLARVPGQRERRDGELVTAAFTTTRVAHGGTGASTPGDLFLPSERRPAWPQQPDQEETSLFEAKEPRTLGSSRGPDDSDADSTRLDALAPSPPGPPAAGGDPVDTAPPAAGSGTDLRPGRDRTATVAAPATSEPSLFGPATSGSATAGSATSGSATAGPSTAGPAAAGSVTFESAETGAISMPVMSAPRAADRASDPFLGVAPAELVNGRVNDPPPAAPPLPDRPAGGAGRRRRRSLLTVAAVAVAALLIGVGYLIWGRLPTGSSPAPNAAPAAGATAGAPTGAGPVAPQAAGPQPAAAVPAPTVSATVRVGSTPGFVVVSPDGRTAMVANQAAGVITVLDTATNTVSATIPVAAGPPQYLSFAPDGRRVYVSVWDQARTIAAVGVLDTATNTMRATIPVRTRPYLSAVTPDGAQLYVPNHDSGTVSVIDTATEKVTTEIKVAPNPHWVEMSQDGSRAYTANHESNLVSVIDTSNNSILAEVPVQLSPHSLAAHPTRPLIANVNYDSASVTMIDTNTDRVVATIPVGKNPQDITWSPDGRFAYVVNTSDSTVSVIDADTAKVTATIPTGTAPTSVSVLPNGTEAYISNRDDGTLTVLDIDG